MMTAMELHPRNSARIFQLLKSKHPFLLMMKSPSQSENQSRQREGHVAEVVLVVEDEVVAAEVVEVEQLILREALLPEISFSLL
jgi:hypothetical protein